MEDVAAEHRRRLSGVNVQEEGVTDLLLSPENSGIPGVMGTRCLAENLSDLKAQVAANAKGIALVKGLIAEYSLSVVQSYMQHIQSNAETAVRSMLVEFSHRHVRFPATAWTYFSSVVAAV
jgi:5-oxoprolinase (ATP-hydrolysing)